MAPHWDWSLGQQKVYWMAKQMEQSLGRQRALQWENHLGLGWGHHLDQDLVLHLGLCLALCLGWQLDQKLEHHWAENSAIHLEKSWAPNLETH